MALSVRHKMNHDAGWVVKDDHDVIDPERKYVLWWSWLERGAFQLMWWKQHGRVHYRCTCQAPGHPVKGTPFTGTGTHPDEAVAACLHQLHQTIAGLTGLSQSINLPGAEPGKPAPYPAVTARLVPAGTRPTDGDQFVRLGKRLYYLESDGEALKLHEAALDGSGSQVIFTKGYGGSNE